LTVFIRRLVEVGQQREVLIDRFCDGVGANSHDNIFSIFHLRRNGLLEVDVCLTSLKPSGLRVLNEGFVSFAKKRSSESTRLQLGLEGRPAGCDQHIRTNRALRVIEQNKLQKSSRISTGQGQNKEKARETIAYHIAFDLLHKSNERIKRHIGVGEVGIFRWETITESIFRQTRFPSTAKPNHKSGIISQTNNVRAHEVIARDPNIVRDHRNKDSRLLFGRPSLVLLFWREQPRKQPRELNFGRFRLKEQEKRNIVTARDGETIG
jgi:hypothetical protein